MRALILESADNYAEVYVCNVELSNALPIPTYCMLCL